METKTKERSKKPRKRPLPDLTGLCRKCKLRVLNGVQAAPDCKECQR